MDVIVRRIDMKCYMVKLKNRRVILHHDRENEIWKIRFVNLIEMEKVGKQRVITDLALSEEAMEALVYLFQNIRLVETIELYSNEEKSKNDG